MTVDQKKLRSGLSSELIPLFRPARSKYVKNKKVLKTCVFCAASKAKVSLKSLCVFKSQHSMVVLNKFPYNSGHILILPQAHIGSLSLLGPDPYLDLMMLLKLSEKVISKIYQPSGINIGLNQGAAAGAGIPDHLHFHLIPRWNGDLNFFPIVAKTKVIIEDLSESYQKLSQAFTKMS